MTTNPHSLPVTADQHVAVNAADTAGGVAPPAPPAPVPDANGWMTIDTAPKEPLNKYSEEGPTILLCGGYSGESVRTGHWKAKRTNRWCDTALGPTPMHPTHWQSLPKPPVSSC